MKNIAFLLSSLGILIAGTGFGYYYGFYLPNKPSNTDIMIYQGYQSAKNKNIKDSVQCNKIFDKEASIGCMKYANEEKEKEHLAYLEYSRRFTEDQEFIDRINSQIESVYQEKTRVKHEIDKLN